MRDPDEWPVPERITWALDMPQAPGAEGPLEGPGVDEFCGVQEPTVDLWETGEVIPSEEELARLAELTGYSLEWFYRPVLDLSGPGTFMCVGDGPRHGCYHPDDPALLTALALADVGEVSRVPRPAPRPQPSTPRAEPRRRTVTVTTASMPECLGCQAPMRRTVWVTRHGRCSSCS